MDPKPTEILDSVAGTVVEETRKRKLDEVVSGDVASSVVGGAETTINEEASMNGPSSAASVVVPVAEGGQGDDDVNAKRVKLDHENGDVAVTTADTEKAVPSSSAVLASEPASTSAIPPLVALPPSCFIYANPDGQTGVMVPLVAHPVKWAIDARQKREEESKLARGEMPVTMMDTSSASDREIGAGDIGAEEGEAEAEWTYHLRESDVGISEYLSAGLGQMQGIIKQRFTDFMVYEITPRGEIVHLKDIGMPDDTAGIVAEAGEDAAGKEKKDTEAKVEGEMKNVGEKVQEKETVASAAADATAATSSIPVDSDNVSAATPVASATEPSTTSTETKAEGDDVPKDSALAATAEAEAEPESTLEIPEELSSLTEPENSHKLWTASTTLALLPILPVDSIKALHALLREGKNVPKVKAKPPIEVPAAAASSDPSRPSDNGWGRREVVKAQMEEEEEAMGNSASSTPSATAVTNEEEEAAAADPTGPGRWGDRRGGRGQGRDRGRGRGGAKGGRGGAQAGAGAGGRDGVPKGDQREVLSDVSDLITPLVVID